MTADQVAAVTDVLYEYCVRVDANHQPEVLELFTDDAVYDHGHGRIHAGKAALAELFRALDDNATTSHHLSNVRVRIAADGTAQAHSYLYAYHRRRATGAEVHLWGRYVDTLVWTDAGWRFRRRVLLAAAERGVTPDPGWPSRYQLIDRRDRGTDGRAG